MPNDLNEWSARADLKLNLNKTQNDMLTKNLGLYLNLERVTSFWKTKEDLNYQR